MESFYIKLKPTDFDEKHKRLPMCASKFWGDADLPEKMTYPSVYVPELESEEPYHFICQINLADLPPHHELPDKGLLQFYANIHYYLGWDCDLEIFSYPCNPAQVKVLYFPDPDPADFCTRIVVGDDESDRLFPQEMALHFVDSLRIEDPKHHLLGEPEFREWEDWDKPCQGWRVLLQVDSFEGEDFNLNFMDCGVLDFLIAEEDLKKCDFSKVRAIVLST